MAVSKIPATTAVQLVTLLLLCTVAGTMSSCTKTGFMLKYLGLDNSSCTEDEVRFPFTDWLITERAKPLMLAAAASSASNLVAYEPGMVANRFEEHSALAQSSTSALSNMGKVGELLGDLVGVLVTEVLRKFSDTLGDAARLKVADMSTTVLNQGGGLLAELTSAFFA